MNTVRFRAAAPLARATCALLAAAGAMASWAQSTASGAPPAGAGRGGDRPQQAVIAANRQADAAFQRADRNGDGRLSRAEADHLPAIAERFNTLDADGDDFVSRAEFNRVLP